MAGTLHGTVLGRPFELEAVEREILLTLSDFRSAWQLRKNAPSLLFGLLRLLRDFGFTVKVEVARRVEFEVVPQTSKVLLLLSPRLRSL